MKLVIFDFDGVLVDTLLPCWQAYIPTYGEITLEKYKSLYEGNIYETVDQKEGKVRPEDYFHEYDLRTQEREIKVPPELKIVLTTLALENDLAIVSSTPYKFIARVLEKEKIKEIFKDIFGMEAHTKKVIKINSLLEKYNLSPSDAVYVTDTLGDIKEAHACEVRAIAVTWGFHERETLEKGQPFRIVNLPGELLQAIKDL